MTGDEEINPLVCVCPYPLLGPNDECRVCYRKPLARFRLLRSLVRVLACS